jgi:hypothetical protein
LNDPIAVPGCLNKCLKSIANCQPNLAGYEIRRDPAHRGHLQAEGGAAKEAEENHSSLVRLIFKIFDFFLNPKNRPVIRDIFSFNLLEIAHFQMWVKVG